MSDSDEKSVVITPLSTGDELLDAREDLYDGMIVEIKNSAVDVDGFVASLRASLRKWKQDGKKGIWIKVPTEHAKLVPAVIEEGFWYHHAEPEYVMLVYWIPKSDPCTFPANASHQVRVGGFVINANQEILVVQEKNGPYENSRTWNWPSGLLHQGEDIFTGAIREVKEKTGIDTEFLEVAEIRHSHAAPFQKSDLFFVCILRPISFDIKIEESKIAAPRWMRIEEFARQPKYRKSVLNKKIIDVFIANSGKQHKGFSAVPAESSSKGSPSVRYYNVEDMNQFYELNDIIP